MANQVIPSGTLERSLRKGMGVCNTHRPHLEYFEELAKAAPELDELVTKLRVKLEHLDKLCRAGLLLTRDGLNQETE